MQYSAEPYSAVQFSAVQYSAVQEVKPSLTDRPGVSLREASGEVDESLHWPLAGEGRVIATRPKIIARTIVIINTILKVITTSICC